MLRLSRGSTAALQREQRAICVPTLDHTAPYPSRWHGCGSAVPTQAPSPGREGAPRFRMKGSQRLTSQHERSRQTPSGIVLPPGVRLRGYGSSKRACRVGGRLNSLAQDGRGMRFAPNNIGTRRGRPHGSDVRTPVLQWLEAILLGERADHAS
jgi:hypothetical protein